MAQFSSKFRQLLGIEKKASLAAPDAFLLDLFGATGTNAGIQVSPRTAMRCAPVHCAVRTIAEAIGQLPVAVYKRGTNGEKEPAPDHPVQRLLQDAANSFTPAGQFREDVTQDAALYPYGGFAHIGRASDGRVVELVRIDPEQSSIIIDYVNLEPIYAYRQVSNGTGNVTTQRVDAENILHIPSPSLQRLGMVNEAREAIALAVVLEQHAARLFGNSARPSGVLSLKRNGTNATTLDNIKAIWNAAHGSGKSGGTAILPDDVSWQQVVLNSVDAQFHEMRRFAIAEIARFWRVPLHMMSELERATFKNAEQLGSEFLTYTLLPWIRRWEGELNLKLFTEEERGTYSVEFDTDAIIRADMLARIESLSVAVSSRILNPNEARRMGFGLPGYKGGEEYVNPNTTSPHAQPRLIGGVNP